MRTLAAGVSFVVALVACASPVVITPPPFTVLAAPSVTPGALRRRGLLHDVAV